LPKPSGRPVVSAHEHPPVAAVVQTDVGAKDGVSKCPFCGSSDIALNIATGNLRCNYCHREIAPEVDPLDYDIGTLTGVVMGSAAQDIPADTATMITLRCTGCGAEVVVNTAETLQARCHWCRSALSINQQIPNGAVPDALIPFRLPKQKAQELIWGFVGNRQFYAHPRFKAEFNINNIMGVYLPYMVIDVNAHADLRGQGEHLVRKYGDNDNPLYDADLYNVGRAFDLHVDDLAVEANAQRMHQVAGVTTNNIINSILPYPLKNTVRFNANYLRGFTSEKRDVNRVHIAPIVDAQVRDIARVFAKRDATFYNRGIHWDQVAVETRGQLWKTVYLPVWLYSYLEVKSSGQRLLHYVACNAVTGETMGSVPLHMPRLAAVTALIETVCAVIGIGLTGLFLWLSF
jgi:ribosomal protein S27E